MSVRVLAGIVLVAATALGVAVVPDAHDRRSARAPVAVPALSPDHEPSSSGRACGKRVLGDWYGDGRVDGHYRHACYAAALGMIPTSGPDDLSPWRDGLRRDHARDARSRVVDEREGAFRLLGLGSTDLELAAVLGSGKTDGGFAPVGTLPAEVAVPLALPAPVGVRGAPELRRYDDRAFLLARERVYAMLVAANDARTTRGVGIGDPIAKVRQLYRGARCYRAPGGERDGSVVTYPVCRVAIGPLRYLSFGGDPIRSFTLYSRERR